MNQKFLQSAAQTKPEGCTGGGGGQGAGDSPLSMPVEKLKPREVGKYSFLNMPICLRRDDSNTRPQPELMGPSTVAGSTVSLSAVETV
jgi:hypothetical protein